jgi:hypothetical protein
MKLPIRDIVLQVFQFLWESRTDLVRMMAVPVFALTILRLALFAVAPLQTPEDIKAMTGMQTMAVILVGLLQMAFYTMFAVAWHRRCLRPEEQTTILTALKWDGRKTRFLLRFILISLVAAVGALPIIIIASIVGFAVSAGLATADKASGFGALLLNVFPFVLFFVVFVIQTRLSLLLPATAIDQKLTLMETWVMGRGNTWNLVAILLLAAAPAMVIVILVNSAAIAIAYATGLGGTLTFVFVAQLAINFASYIVIATGVSALSISYRALRQTPSPGMPYQM